MPTTRRSALAAPFADTPLHVFADETIDLRPLVDPVAPTPATVSAQDDTLGKAPRVPFEKGEGAGLAPTADDSPTAADTVVGDTSTTSSIAIGGSVDVTIDTTSDHDWYRVTLTAGTNYTFITSKIFGGGNPDSYLILRGAGGASLVENDDGGDQTFSVINYTAPTTGTYYIDAATYSGQGQSSSGSYHLSLVANPAGTTDRVGGTAGAASTLALNGIVSGRIDSTSDHDWYAIQLTAGETYIFRTGNTLPLDPNNDADVGVDTYLTLRDASGAQILANDDVGEYSYSGIRYTASSTGTYYLDVSGVGGAAGVGAFNLTAFTTPIPPVYTYDQIATQLTSTFWGGPTRHFAVSPGGTLTFNVQGLTAPAQVLARAALAVWTEVSGITFSEVFSGGQIVYDDTDDGAFATSVVSGGIITSSAVNVSAQWIANYGAALNTYSFQTFLHETGHALGLGHAGNYNGNADYLVDAEYQNDAWATTVMSYFSQTENSYFQGQGFTREFIMSPMVADGIAIASLYGANTLTRTGNTTYGFNNNSGSQIYDAAQFPQNSYTIFDNGGIDTLDYSGFAQNQLINLNAETFSNVGGRNGNVAIARGTVIENAIGGSGDDTIIGNDSDNTINLSRGGSDTASGGAGTDGFFFGAAMDASDKVDGGAGFDQIGLQGNYAGLVLGAGSAVGIENVVLLSGADIRFGESGANRYSYALTVTDAVVPAGQRLAFSANTLRAGENFTLNASAEMDGIIVTYGGAGTNNITGGQQSDGFYFGKGLWGADDRVDGQGGNLDQLAIQGDYTGSNSIVFGPDQLVSIENLVLLSASDQRFGGGGTVYSYTITLNDANVTTGPFAVSANTLRGSETLTLNASAETSAGITVYSGAGADYLLMGQGADRVFGGAGGDWIVGGGGADDLSGGAGNDNFFYAAVSQSTAAARDHILDFSFGDTIDLSALDANPGVAGMQGFTFIGAGAFTAAGQLHVVSAGGNDWLIEADIDGNGSADLSILVTSDHQLGPSDFYGVSAQAQQTAPAPVTLDAVDLKAAFVDAHAAPDMMAADTAFHPAFVHELVTATAV